MPNWTDFLFGKKPLQQAAQGPSPIMPQGNGNAGIDIAAMAQQQADAQQQPQFQGAPQPTMQQLQGLGTNGQVCRTCGKVKK